MSKNRCAKHFACDGRGMDKGNINHVCRSSESCFVAQTSNNSNNSKNHHDIISKEKLISIFHTHLKKDTTHKNVYQISAVDLNDLADSILYHIRKTNG